MARQLDLGQDASMSWLIFTLAAAMAAPGDQLTIRKAFVDERGELSVHCRLSFSTNRRVYSWRGSLQPLLGRVVLLELRGDDGDSIDVVGVARSWVPSRSSASF